MGTQERTRDSSVWPMNVATHLDQASKEAKDAGNTQIAQKIDKLREELRDFSGTSSTTT